MIERSDVAGEELPVFTRPYVKATLPPARGTELHLAPVHVLANMVTKVAEMEAPVHLSEVTKRLMDAYGVARAGSRITSRVQEAVEHCVRVGKLDFRGEFVYNTRQGEIAPRDRSGFSPSDKRLNGSPRKKSMQR